MAANRTADVIRNVEKVRQILLGAGVILLLLGTLAGHATAQCVQPPSGLVSWWPGDGDANDQVGGNHGILQNGTTFAAGFVDQALSLDGLNDYVDTADIDLPSTFTILAWIFPNTLNGVQSIINKDDGQSNRSYYFVFDDARGAGKLVGSVRNTTGGFTQYRTNDVVLSAGQWNHVVLIYNGNLGTNQKMKFYVNGQNVAAQYLPRYDRGGAPENNALTTKIGIFGDAVGSPFEGLIDEVALFDRVLSASEIADLFDTGSAGKCKGASDPTCLGVPATIVGTNDNDTLIGTANADVIVGLAGNDTIKGGGGDDLICGNAGNDRIDGGQGNDELIGGKDDDVLKGDEGNDILKGGEDHDLLWGGSGLDKLEGGKGHDDLSGGDGKDDLSGGSGHDILRGGAGNDRLLGGSGHDVLRGGTGSDRLLGGSGHDALYGGAGNDRLFGGRGKDTLRGGRGRRDVCRGGSGRGDTVRSCEKVSGVP